jgi:hypothetical protein
MEVAFEPYKKVTFQSHLEFNTAEDFVQSIVSGTTPMGMQVQLRLFWANGVLFRFFNHPPSEALSKELLSGNVIFDHIEFAPMPTYKNQLTTENPDVKILVADVSKHVVFGPLSKWIHDKLLQK